MSKYDFRKATKLALDRMAELAVKINKNDPVVSLKWNTRERQNIFLGLLSWFWRGEKAFFYNQNSKIPVVRYLNKLLALWKININWLPIRSLNFDSNTNLCIFRDWVIWTPLNLKKSLPELVCPRRSARPKIVLILPNHQIIIKRGTSVYLDWLFQNGS